VNEEHGRSPWNGSTLRFNEVNLGCLPFPTDERTKNNHSYYKIYFVLLSIHTAVAAVEKICKYGSSLTYSMVQSPS